jgi:hypothetical protein
VSENSRQPAFLREGCRVHLSRNQSYIGPRHRSGSGITRFAGTGSVPKLAVVLFAALALVLPASAEAGWRIDRATAIAGIVWQHPCQDAIAIRVTQENEIAWTTDDTPCVVFLGRHARTAWEPFCHTILHEVGHLAGMGHSRNPRSVMWPFLPADQLVTRHGTVWVGVDKRCRERGRPYLEKHGVLSP